MHSSDKFVGRLAVKTLVRDPICHIEPVQFGVKELSDRGLTQLKWLSNRFCEKKIEINRGFESDLAVYSTRNRICVSLRPHIFVYQRSAVSRRLKKIMRICVRKLTDAQSVHLCCSYGAAFSCSSHNCGSGVAAAALARNARISSKLLSSKLVGN